MTARQLAIAATARDEDALIADARAGGREAFTELFRRHVDRVRTHLTHLIGPVPAREDLVQEVFLKLHQALPSYRGDSALSTFLHRVTVNAALDHLRSVGRRRTEPLPDGALDALIGPSIGEAERAEARDDLRRLFRLLDRLTAKKRVAFLLVAVEGLSLSEAAAAVGVTPDALKQRVLSARRKLKRMIDDERGVS